MTDKLGLLALGAIACSCGGDSEAPLGPGDVVWSASVRELVISSEGGGLLPSPPKSECANGSAEYTLSVTSLRLDSWRCEGDGSAPLTKVTRSRAITPAELQALEPSLEKLQIVDSKTCGADKPAVNLKITTDGGTSEYRDSFYACFDDPRPPVDTAALSEVFHMLTTLVLGA